MLKNDNRCSRERQRSIARGRGNQGGVALRMKVGQEGCKQAQYWQIRANLVHELDAAPVREQTEARRPHPGKTERKSEKQSRNGADFSRNEVLRIDHDGGEG